MSPKIKHPKRRGEWVELQFMARAASHGLVISKPWGDSARYDFITEHKGRTNRVQVKSTSYASKQGAYLCNTISRAPHMKEKRYNATDIDFFAFFIIPEDAWYVVPFSELKRAKYGVFLNPHVPRNRYFRYLEAWRLLK
jgi:hypothetical protein